MIHHNYLLSAIYAPLNSLKIKSIGIGNRKRQYQYFKKSIGNTNTITIFQKVSQYLTNTAKSIGNTTYTNTILQY